MNLEKKPRDANNPFSLGQLGELDNRRISVGISAEHSSIPCMEDVKWILDWTHRAIRRYEEVQQECFDALQEMQKGYAELADEMKEIGKELEKVKMLAETEKRQLKGIKQNLGGVKDAKGASFS